MFIKNRPATSRTVCDNLIFDDRKVVFANAALGAFPIVGNIGKGGAGGDSIIGIASFGVINPAAYVTDIFFHEDKGSGLKTQDWGFFLES